VNVISQAKQVCIVDHLCRGVGIWDTARLVNVHQATVGPL
jgi:hypothetical protein